MRLIDADELMQEIKSLRIAVNGKSILNDDAKDTILRIIDEQPTAYDIDKVVKVINTNSEMYQKYNYPEDDYEVGFEQGCEYAFENAIEIVKQRLKEQNVQNSIIESLKPKGSADMPKEIVCNCTKEQNK